MTTSPEPSSSRPLVIVVDDDGAVRNSLKFSLEIEGFAVRTYSDGQQLLNGRDASASSCLIIDHNLPGISGLETIARLREEHVNVPAILITSHPTLATAEHARQAHIPIVEKPHGRRSPVPGHAQCALHAAPLAGPGGVRADRCL
jgi:two-component system, LuxR family, response regulator FixJ